MPLLLGQGLCAFTLLWRRESVAWCEASASFLVLAIGACMGLVGQTYHIPGDLPSYFLVWSLLAAPLIYLMNSTTAAVLYICGALGSVVVGRLPHVYWAGDVRPWDGLLFLVQLSVVLPHLLAQLRHERYGPRVTWLARSFSLALLIGYLFTLQWVQDVAVLIYAGFFGLMVLVGELAFPERPAWKNPLAPAGRLGVVALGLTGTLLTWQRVNPGDVTPSDWVVATGSLVLVGGLGWRAWQREHHLALTFALLVPVAWLAHLIAMLTPNADFAGRTLFNLYTFALGLLVLRAGVAAGRLPLLNFGLSILAALIVLRFVDTNLSYTLRGLGFLAIGAAFLGTNLWLRRRVQA